MAMDLSAAGSHVLAGDNGGTGPGDAFAQYVRDLLVEVALGAPGDPAYSGSNTASLVALLKALLTANSPTSAVDGSGTIATGGTAQNLFSSAVPANGFFVQNLSPTDTLYVNETGVASAASGSILLPPNGGNYVSPPGCKPPGAVSVFGASVGHAFTARRW